ncbi:MAG: hypothetical protein FWF85_00435 [Clostridiales bacterium]|nr:hypothetical protein [Clostridiales bacterium]
MPKNNRPLNSISFLDNLPALYSRDWEEGGPLFRDFLKQFEEAFDALEASIIGDALTLVYKGKGDIEGDPEVTGYPLLVETFDAGRLGYPKGSQAFISGDPVATLLSHPIEADGENIGLIRISGASFFKRLKPGDQLVVRSGSGLTGLTSIREMPPPGFRHRGGQDKLLYLQYLASWIGLPLRSDKTVSWNRRFFREAIALAPNRSTLSGLTALLKSWHHEETAAAETVVTDLIAPENGLNTVFCLERSRIGIDTVLGEGQPSHFYVHLTADPTDVSMRSPKKIGAMKAAAKLILDLEKPANTSYTLNIHFYTMQLAPDARIAPYKQANQVRDPEFIDDDELAVKDTNTFARIGVTTLIGNR